MNSSMSTMNGYNERMLEDIITSFNAIYSIYESNIEKICNEDALDSFSELRDLAADICNVKTVVAKEVLCKKLDDLLANTYEKVKHINNIISASGKKFKELRTKMPMPKNEVEKILKTFNFHDCGIDETTDGNLALQHQLENAAYSATNEFRNNSNRDDNRELSSENEMMPEDFFGVEQKHQDKTLARNANAQKKRTRKSKQKS